MMRRILSIDPGYDRCGVAVLQKDEKGDLVLLFSTCIMTDRKNFFSLRLLALRNELLTIVNEWKPTESCIEKLFFAKNTKTALLVAESCGVIRVTLEELTLHPKEYAPSEIKLAVTGYGNADKQAVSYMTRKLLHVGDDKKLDDELDAIAVGITHAFTHRFENLH